MRIRKKVDIDDMSQQEIMLMAKVSNALAHPARIRIFRYIMNCNKVMEKVCNKDVVAAFDYAQATISQHIKVLAKADLIQVKKEDKYSYYYANIGTLGKYLDVTRRFA